MKDTMTKIRALSVEEINKNITELKEELFNLKFQAALGNSDKPARMREIKRTIARMKTVITEKETASKAQ